MNVIESSHLKKFYGTGKEEVCVINDISLKVEKGEFVSIMGPSGSGKSTLLYLLSGMETLSDGEVLLLGKDISTMRDKEKSELRRNKIGFIFQFYNLVSEMSVQDNILLPRLIGNERIDFEQLDSVLNVVGLFEHRNAFPHQLSGGQQQRVAIARALYNKPDIIFADEPTGNLDSKTGTEIMSLFKKINKEFHTSILQVTHSAKQAEYADRIITLMDGGIIHDRANE